MNDNPHSTPGSRGPNGRKRALGAAAAVVAVGTLGLAYFGHGPALAQKADAPSSGIQIAGGRAPQSFADLVDRVKPAVVSISVTGKTPALVSQNGKRGQGRGLDIFPDLPEDNPLRRFFEDLPKGNQTPRPVLAQGSGFVISDDGYVVTNNHVVDGAQKITVSFDANTKYDADLIGTDQRTDVAVIKIKSDKKFPFVKFANASPRVGDWVLAVGNPFGLGGTVTAGIVSALGRDIGSGPYDYMQIDAAVNRGNSGGPTFNLEGDVVGINTAIYSPSGGSVGIAFAIPAATAQKIAFQIKDKGSVTRGWLGVKIQSIDDEMAKTFGLSDAHGALVNEVTANGPAQAAGLKTQDAILAINGQKVADSGDLARKVADYAPNVTVDLTIKRGEKEETVKVKLGTFPASTEVASAEDETPQAGQSSSLGLTFSNNRTKNGVQVTEVDPDSDAATKGFKAGDVVTEVNGQAVANADDVESAVKKAQDQNRSYIRLTVRSDNQTRIVALAVTTAKPDKPSKG